MPRKTKYHFNSFPDDKILDCSELKEIVNGILKYI